MFYDPWDNHRLSADVTCDTFPVYDKDRTIDLPVLRGLVEKLPLTAVRTALLFIVKLHPTREQQKQVPDGRPSSKKKKQAR